MGAPRRRRSDEQVYGVFEHLRGSWEHLDIIVHSVAFAPSGQLRGDYLDDITGEVLYADAGYHITAMAIRERTEATRSASSDCMAP